MTVKTSEVVTDALEEIITLADEAPIEPTDARSAIRALNDMMNEWAARGIALGYTNVSDMGDNITVALGAISGIKAHLAIRLAPRFDAIVTADLKQKAREGMKAILALAIDTAESAFPSTLPRGSGNAGLYEDKFYSDGQSEILTETGGNIALEDDTEEA